MGDHAEAVSIDYDPSRISYNDLLAEFWAKHRCESPNRSTQYMKAVFYRDETQKQAALESPEPQFRIPKQADPFWQLPEVEGRAG